jgi:hypothetical protein
MSENEPNPFEGCDGLDEIAGLVFHQEGIEGLLVLLDMFLEDKAVSGDDLLKVAGKLEAADLVDAAEAVREIAEKAPTARQVEIIRVLATEYKNIIPYMCWRHEITPEELLRAGVSDELMAEIADGLVQMPKNRPFKYRRASCR